MKCLYLHDLYIYIIFLEVIYCNVDFLFKGAGVMLTLPSKSDLLGKSALRRKIDIAL